MKIRAQLRGEVAEIKVLMAHPMETGLRKDAISGELAPIHFIKNVLATHNNRIVLQAQWSQAVSKNPFLHFRVRGAKPGDRIVVSWEDSRNDTAMIEAILS